MTDIDGVPFPPHDGPAFGEGCELPSHRSYFVTLNVLQSVVIEYRASGFLGFLSRATLRIDEGP